MRAGLICLSGYNQRAVVALCRWAHAHQVPLHLVARDAQDPIYLTDHADAVWLERSSAALVVAEVVGWITDLRKRYDYQQVVFAPSTEFFNRFLLTHRSRVEAAGGVLPLVDEALYCQVSDKQAFANLCTEHGIAVPTAYEQLPIHLPVVAKPRHYGAATSGQIKPYLIHTPAQREAFLARESADNFFFQEFVKGQSLYLLAHLSRSGQVTACAQENLMQQAEGGSIILARAHDFDREPEAQAYLDMLKTVGFHGLVMVEVRRCAHSGRAVMIEANPRMWGPLQFMLDQQVDPLTPLFAEHGVTAMPAEPATARKTYYFWSGGLSKQGAACSFHQYSPDRFIQDYPRIAAADLYARDDTKRLHHHELARA